MNDNKQVRAGCKDIWNAFMVKDAVFCEHDIPFCPTTAKELPKRIVTWEEAKAIHRKRIAKGDRDYHVDAFVCWYIDDIKFDGPSGIWFRWKNTLRILRHFGGAITPDFSTNQDFPESIKTYATYRMRAYGYWLGEIEGLPVINNVRWGTDETFDYCFAGIPKNSIVAIGTVGGGPRKLEDRKRFEEGLDRMMEVLSPHTIIIYGSAKGKCFDDLRDKGIHIIAFQSRTAAAFERRRNHE